MEQNTYKQSNTYCCSRILQTEFCNIWMKDKCQNCTCNYTHKEHDTYVKYCVQLKKRIVWSCHNWERYVTFERLLSLYISRSKYKTKLQITSPFRLLLLCGVWTFSVFVLGPLARVRKIRCEIFLRIRNLDSNSANLGNEKTNRLQ